MADKTIYLSLKEDKTYFAGDTARVVVKISPSISWRSSKTDVKLNSPLFSSPYSVRLRSEETVTVTLANGAEKSSGYKGQITAEGTLPVDGPLQITVKPWKPPVVAFPSDGWISPEREYCIGDKATIKAVLQEAAPEAADYAKLTLNGKDCGALSFSEGGTEATVDVTFDTYKLGSKFRLEPLGDAKAGSPIEKSKDIHQENRVSLESPQSSDPLYTGDTVELTARMKYPVFEAKQTATLKSELFGSTTYPVSFEKDASEAKITVTIETVPESKKFPVTAEPATGFRSDSSATIQLRAEKGWALSFKGDPTPAGAYHQGDTVTFTIAIPHPAPEDGDAGTISCDTAFDPVTVHFAKDATETTVEATIKAVTKKQNVDVLVSPKDGSVYVAAKSNAKCRIEIKPLPVIRFDNRNPVQGEKPGENKAYVSRVTRQLTLTVRSENMPTRTGSKVKIISDPDVFGDEDPNDPAKPPYFAEFTGEEKEKAVTVTLAKPATETTVKFEVVDDYRARLAEQYTEFKLKVTDGALNVIDGTADGSDYKWIKPAGPYAKGDKVWLRVTRTMASGPLIEGYFAAITSPAFGKDPETGKDRIYKVWWDRDKTVSRPVQHEPGQIIKDENGLDATPRLSSDAPTTASPGQGQPPTDPPTGLRLLGHGSKPLSVTVSGIGTYGDGQTTTQSIEVQDERIAYFAEGLYGKTNAFVVKDKPKFVVNLNVPAGPGSLVTLSSEVFPGGYNVPLPPGTLTREVPVELVKSSMEARDGEGTVEAQIEVHGGNLTVPRSGSRKAIIQLDVRTPVVTFDDAEPIKPPVKEGKKGVAGLFGLDDTATLRLALSEKAPEGAKAEIISYAFGSKRYAVDFAAGDTAKEIEVQFVRGDADKPVAVWINPLTLCKADTNKDGSYRRSQIAVTVMPDPAVAFQNTVMTDGACTANWIVPTGIPFIFGEKATFYLVLSHAAPEGGAEAKVVSPVIGGDKTVSFAEGETAKSVEVTFTKPSKSKSNDQSITIEAVSGCVVGGYFNNLVQVYEVRAAYLPPRRVMIPRGPFVKGQTAKISIRLNIPAATEGASVKLTGPFAADVPVSFALGETRQTVEVTFDKETQEAQDITLVADKGCTLGQKTTQTVTVYTPKVSFADPAVEEPEQVIPGGEAVLFLKLDAPAPEQGASVLIESDAFPEGKAYKAIFPLGETEAAVTVKIPFDLTLGGQTKPVTLKADPTRCVLGDTTSINLEIHEGLRVRFSESKMDPAPDAVLDAGTEATVSIEPTEAPTEDLKVMIKSSAFNGRVYVVTLPKDSTTAVKQKIVLTRGLSENGGEVPEQRIYLVAPRGWIADPTKDSDSQADPEPNRSVIRARVKSPAPTSGTQSCPSHSSQSTPPEENEAPPPEPPKEPDFDAPCNLHRMRLTVAHGGEDGTEPAKDRGENGVFEVVRDKNLADKPATALVCSNSRIPILQVTGRRRYGDPHLTFPDKTPHHTTITVTLDDRDAFCQQVFQYADGKNPMQHPIITVLERVKGRPNRLERAFSNVADKVYMVEEKVTDAFDKATAKPRALIQKAGTKRQELDEAIQRKMDQVTDLFEPVVQAKRRVLTKIGDTLGLEVDEAEEEPPEEEAPPPEEKPRTSWASRYEWNSIEQTPKNVREQADQKGAVYEFPAYQADQLWHEAPEEKEPEDTSPTGKLLGLAPKINIGGGGDEEGGKKQGFGLIRDVMSALTFAFMAPRQYLIEAETCGIPTTDPVDAGGPAGTLQAIVEVYPSDEFCLHYEYSPGLAPVKVGLEGSFYSPQKGDGEKGLKSTKEDDKQTEEKTESKEEKPKVFTYHVGFQDDEEPKDDEGDDDDEEEEITVDMPEAKGEGLIEAPMRGTGEAFLVESGFMGIGDPPQKPQPGEPHTPSRVIHPFSKEEDEEEEEQGLLAQLWKQLKDEKVVEAEIQRGDIVGAGVDLDAASGGSLTKAQNFLDDNVFKITEYGIVLTRNGKTGPFYYEITKAVSASINTVRAIVAVFNGLGGGWVPSYGWGLKLNISFLEGNLNVYWGWKEYSDHRVFKWYSVQTDMSLVSFSFQVDFGFRAHALLVKFEAIIYGKLTLEATISAGFERQSPDTKIPEWLDTWLGTVGKAELGANLVLVHENVFHVNAAIKTGFEFQYRISPGLLDRFGMEYKIYWMGLIVSATFKVIAFKEKTKSVPLVEGNPKELPWRRGAFPKKAATAWWNLKQIVNLAWSRASYQHMRHMERLTAFQTLQLDMVTGSKKPDSRYPLTETLPGYRFDGNPETDSEGLETWEQNKEKWDEQWEDCKRAFNLERKSVHSSILRLPYDLSDRLNSKTRDLEHRIAGIIDRMKRIDAIKEEIITMNEDIAEAEQEADEGSGAEKSFQERAKTLSRKDDINIYEHLGNRPLQKIDDLLDDLRYYALKRQQW